MLSGNRSLEKNPTFMRVVAGALQRQDGLWLMHKRPLHKQHGGLWEFPGGKAEVYENQNEALIRELHEELGIKAVLDSHSSIAEARHASPTGGEKIVIALYTCRYWVGEPQALEGGSIGWFTPDEINKLDKPPLDAVLAEKLFEELADKGLQRR